MGEYAKDALSTHLKPLTLTERKVRAANLWGQDRERRLRAVLNVLRSQGMTVDLEKRDDMAEPAINALVDLKPSEVLQALGCT